MSRWRRPLRSWLISSHLVVLLLPLVALFGTGALSQDLLTQARISLLDQGALIAMMVQDIQGSRAPEDQEAALGRLVEALSERSQTAIRILDADGRVIATSGPRLGEDLSPARGPQGAAGLAGLGGPQGPTPQPQASRTGTLRPGALPHLRHQPSHRG